MPGGLRIKFRGIDCSIVDQSGSADMGGDQQAGATPQGLQRLE